MLFQAFFNTPQTEVGYQFYGADGALIGTRITAGLDPLPEPGGYLVDAVVPTGAVGIFWTSYETPNGISEDLREALAALTKESIASQVRTELATELARIDANISSVSSPTLAQISSAVDATLTTNHGTGSWQTGTGGSSGGTGARVVNVTVNNGVNVVEGAKVRLTNGLESYLLITNSNGQVTFNVDDATWTVSITKPGYLFTGASLTVLGSINVTYSIQQILVAAPADPDLCMVYVDTETITGNAITGLSIEIELESNQPAVTISGSAPSNTPQIMVEDLSVPGRYAIELEKGLVYRAKESTLFGATGHLFATANDSVLRLP